MAEIVYRDLDLNFIPHPLTGDLLPKKDVEAIKSALRHIFLLNPYDIPFQEDVHANINQFLFEPVSRLTANTMHTALSWTIRKLEPRAKVIEMSIIENEKEDGYEVTIVFSPVSLLNEDSITFFISRTR